MTINYPFGDVEPTATLADRAFPRRRRQWVGLSERAPQHRRRPAISTGVTGLVVGAIITATVVVVTSTPVTAAISPAAQPGANALLPPGPAASWTAPATAHHPDPPRPPRREPPPPPEPRAPLPPPPAAGASLPPPGATAPAAAAGDGEPPING